ncbi:hypothetical protein LPJ75_005064 [Coemansia sp. RSA 2598]|nr:hypothetical protein LPJ75_005064 [Coemansia sp. RSA 2598]
MVYMDPGRRQLFYAMGENSTSEIPLVFRSTAAEHMRTLKQHNTIWEQVKTPEVLAAEQELSTVNCHTLNLEAYEDYIHMCARHWNTLGSFYADTPTVAPNEDHQHRKHQERQEKWMPLDECLQHQQEHEQQD